MPTQAQAPIDQAGRLRVPPRVGPLATGPLFRIAPRHTPGAGGKCSDAAEWHQTP